MLTLLLLAATVRSSAHMPLGISDRNSSVATSGPTIWTSTYGLEPGLYNRLLIELSGWAQTVHMFTQRFT